MAALHAVDAHAQAVTSGRVPAGKYHRLACARHERDRAREGTRRFPYRFDPALADRFFRFAESLKHYKGEWGGQFIMLAPYQRFRLGSIFGWVHVRTGLRRFRTAYNEIPRKNGKSLEAAIVALHATFFDHEPGAEGYCIATKREQSKIVHDDCKQLVKSSGLRSRIRVLENSLHREDPPAKLRPLGADKDSTDGLHPNLIINDEFHAQKDRGMLDVMETATGARRQPLNFQITTAGSDLLTPCGDQHAYACQILDRVLVDETFFAFIAHADADDDWKLPSTWRKANPNYGVSVKVDDLRALATKAIHMEKAAAAFKQKRLNLWVNTLAPWLSLEGWAKGQSRWTLEEMRGALCYVGVDMSSKIDLTAVVVLFPPTLDRPTWRVLPWCLTPADTLEERAHRDRAPYELWRDHEILLTNPGNRIDQDEVRALVRRAGTLFNVQKIGIDPWNAGNLVKDLTEDGFQVEEIPQTLAQMSLTCKEFEADVLDGLVDAGGHPLMLWSVSNVVAPTDGKENLYPLEKKSRGRIDPVIAALMARRLAAAGEEPPAEDPVLLVA